MCIWQQIYSIIFLYRTGDFMEIDKLKQLLRIGETISVEFKRCSNQIEHDTYETICSFSNRFGGDVFLGIDDDGNIMGVSENNAPYLIKNFIKIISNPQFFSPTLYLEPVIMTIDHKSIIHIHVPMSSEIHKYKNVIYDRVDDADVKITTHNQIANMYIRKQNMFTERKIFPYVTQEDLRLDLIQKARKMAIAQTPNHPWRNLDDDALLRSAGLYAKDLESGLSGYNLAAILLLGKDETILSACPAYKTDAIYRDHQKDRYDDRIIIKTNLIESYHLLIEFIQKHMDDRFHLDGDRRISLRDIIAREIISNILIHREYTNSFVAKVIISKDQLLMENACRANRSGEVTPDNFEPDPKNPIISNFFRNIGLADELGSGVRNLYKYSMMYSGQAPSITENDIFTISIPFIRQDLIPSHTKSSDKSSKVAINSESSDKSSDKPSKVAINSKSSDKSSDKALKVAINQNENHKRKTYEASILEYLSHHKYITTTITQELTGLSVSGSRKLLANMVNQHLLQANGANKNRTYTIDEGESE